MSAPYKPCRDNGCDKPTGNPSGLCYLHHPVDEPDDHPGGDGLDDDDGYWANNEPEVELLDARY